MKLVNLHNVGRTVYIFTRDENGLKIETDNSFYPYYFEPDSDGKYKAYLNNQTYRKVICPEQRDIRKQASPYALGTDIQFTKNYLLDKIDVIEETTPKIGFLDIEIKTKEMPKHGDYTKPISCISINDYSTGETYTWFIGDLEGTIKERERIVLDSFCEKMKELAFDIVLVWNSSFDIPYINGRCKHWATRCSVVGKSRYGYRTDIGEYINFPVGTSYLDYMEMFKKYTLNKWAAYNLDYVLEKELGEGKKYKDVDFNKLTEELKLRNRDDVIDMAKLEKKFKLVEYFNSLRILTYSDWEELPSRTTFKFGKMQWNSNNSRMVDSYLIKKAKDLNVILPNKPRDNEDSNYDGAFREAFETGVHFDLHKLDFDSMYPRMIMDFNLDPINFVETKTDTTVNLNIKSREAREITNSYYLENKEGALLPQIIKDLIVLKNTQKQELKVISPDSKEYKQLTTAYKSTKSFLNSCYGVFGMPFFRMYDKRVAESTTFCARDLVLYLIDKARQEGYNFVYSDTDSLMFKGDIEYVKKMNEYIKDWGDEYGVQLTAKLDYEGTYESIIILKVCRYYGRLKTDTGIKEDKCGVEALRNDSTIYMKKFQEILFNKILDNCKKDDIIEWIRNERKNITSLELMDIGKPCKVQNKEYKTEKMQNGKTVKMPPPAHVRARINANKILKSKIAYGSRFHFVNMLPFAKEETGHLAIHMGFKDSIDHIKRDKIDWNKVTELNIDNKAKVIFTALKWTYDMSGQMDLF